MIEIKICLFSKAESLLGIMVDQGEFEIGKDSDKWIPFIRVRFGFIFFTLDFVYLKTK